jgi:hypothetical protein
MCILVDFTLHIGYISVSGFQESQLKRIQCDEIWSFCYAKEKNVPEDKKGQFGYGDVYTWTAIDAETKLVPSWVCWQA